MYKRQALIWRNPSEISLKVPIISSNSALRWVSSICLLYTSNGSLTKAQNALLTVAKRNADITYVSDLPAPSDGLMKFLKDERARELFQEGLRLYDLRRWDENAEVYAAKAPTCLLYTSRCV